MKAQLSTHKAKLLEFIKENPGQTCNDYKALMDALAEQMGSPGRLIKVESALHALYAQGYVTRTGSGGQADQFRYFVNKAKETPTTYYPAPARKSSSKATGGYNFKVVYKIDFPSGNGIPLSHEDAKAVFQYLNGVFQ